MAANIVVVGSFNADLTSYLQRMPQPGETVPGERFVIGAGGKGSNQAVAAARLGADVAFIGRVGRDVFADLAFDIWDKEGVERDFVRQDAEVATGVAPIQVDAQGENSIVVVLGANLRIQRGDIAAARQRIAAADLLLTQLEISLPIVHYALETAQQLGIRSILNPAPALPLPAETLALADYITPNESELATLAGTKSADLARSARALLRRAGQTAVLTLGARGAQIVSATTSSAVPAFAVDVVDTTGAGDAFNAGLAVALAEGQALPAAVRFANATAALCVTKPGTARSTPYRSDVDALLSNSET